MKDNRDIDLVLSNLTVRPNTEAKQAAFERMTARQAELLVNEETPNHVTGGTGVEAPE